MFFSTSITPSVMRFTIMGVFSFRKPSVDFTSTISPFISYGALRQAAAFYGIAAVGHERVVAFMVDVEVVESSYPQAVL